jgi:ABC-type transport system involved in cytochrome bd biosynthesis fused ATPase/permease subunit
VRYGDAVITAAPPGLGHRPFAWVPQDSAMLADTVEANVQLGRVDHDAGDRSVADLLRELGGESLIERCGATDAPKLGPGGVVVSGGERQWIAFARALATSQPVLVLDEPTSGLDGRSQERTLEAIARLRGARSVLLVTHRAEPLALAHTVVRFAGGEVSVEAGPRQRERAGEV